MTNPAMDATAGDRGRLVVSCPDRPGIVAAVSRFLFERGANVVHSDQHTTDPAGGVFFVRVEFDLSGLEELAPGLRAEFAAIADRYGMAWGWRRPPSGSVWPSSTPRRTTACWSSSGSAERGICRPRSPS